MGLLSECQRWRDSLSRNRTLMEQIEKSQAEREAAPEPVIRYPQALKEIFGTSASKLRQDRAEPKLLRAIAEVYGSEDVAPLLLAQFKLEGIEASIVETEKAREAFDSVRACKQIHALLSAFTANPNGSESTMPFGCSALAGALFTN